MWGVFVETFKWECLILLMILFPVTGGIALYVLYTMSKD